MNKVLAVIDVQNDFVTGSLGSELAQAAMDALIAKVKAFDGEIVVTHDTHDDDYLNSSEGKNLPVKHCIIGTDGWQLDPRLQEALKDKKAVNFNKPTFGSTAMCAYLKSKFEAGTLDEVEFIGFCTDICVISNVLLLKAMCPELAISADSSCCAGVTAAKHEAALEVMRSCQIEVK